MKKSILFTIIICILSLFAFAQEDTEGIKSLKKKCKEVRKQLEEKYGEDIISHDCDISVMYGFALESTYSFKSNPECKSKITAHFTKGFTEIIKIQEEMNYERYAFLRKEKALNLLKPILSSFTSFEINYSPIEIAINLSGKMNESNNNNLKQALEIFSKDENKDLLTEKSIIDGIENLIPRFYVYIKSESIDTTVYPLIEIEKNTLPENIIKLEKKWGVKAKTYSEYSIFTDINEMLANNAMKHLQRKLNAYSPENDDYSISVGGFNYINF